MSSREYLQSGRYVALKKLGEGGKGVAYKAGALAFPKAKPFSRNCTQFRISRMVPS